MKTIESIERKIDPAVSEEMLQEARNLRELARQIESGDVFSVAYAWVSADEYREPVSNSTYCIDSHMMTLIGGISQVQMKLVKRSIDLG